MCLLALLALLFIIAVILAVVGLIVLIFGGSALLFVFSDIAIFVLLILIFIKIFR